MITELYDSNDSNRPRSIKAVRAQLGELPIEDLDLSTGSVTVLHDMFIVDDLTEGYSYTVAHSDLGYLLTFTLNGGNQVVVVVNPSDDFELVAQKIARRLMTSGNQTLRLRFDRPLNNTGGA